MMTEEPLDTRLARMPVCLAAFTRQAPGPADMERFMAQYATTGEGQA